MLARNGYNGMTIESIAGRAGVAKTTIYRRWPSKGPLVTEALSTQIHLGRAPDSGDTRADLAAFLHAVIDVLREPLILQTLPGLALEGRDQAVASALSSHLVAPKRARLAEILDRAAARGELRAGLDYELVLDMLVGPVLWAALLTRRALDDEFVGRLVDRVVRAIGLRAPKGTRGAAGGAAGQGSQAPQLTA